ncbi:GlxA family transcriptional regulator [Lutibaculum baratangense]|uniref:Transcriptional regulator containing an amidase n=1 Tax=Lutibaculum baratangense AMV1 TaxID=631454 RepID=V4RGW3_9HYPH|nr:GlxA family transcriptional regulator [Lutibaculum baratangense]ESR22530.1 Transcriptional regulator containing an amidase [Lutibaculum baratangense AMV1]
MAPVFSPEPKVDGSRLKVGFVLADRFTLSAFSLFVDCLRLAGDEGDRSRPIDCSWEILGGWSSPARSSCGASVSCSTRYPDPSRYDYLVVVGGILEGPQVSEECYAYIRAAAEAGVRLVGLCTGSFVLTRAGLMTGRRCCVSWFHYQDFVDEFPRHKPIADRLYVVDGDRITCSGGLSVADLAHDIVVRHLGAAVADKSWQVLLGDRPRTGERSQPLPREGLEAADPRVRRAMLLMEQNLFEPLATPDLAERLGLSRRQLERLFHETLGEGPATTYLRMRLDYAMALLRGGRSSIMEIATAAGFRDHSHFTRSFRRRFGVPPSTVRRSGEDGRRLTCIAGQRVFGRPSPPPLDPR